MVLKANRISVREVLTPLADVEESTMREVVRAPVKAMLEVGAPLTTMMVTETMIMTVIVAEVGRVPVAVRTAVLRQKMKMMDEMHVDTASVRAPSMVTLHSRHSGRSFRTVTYNRWKSDDQLAFLKASLVGDAAQLL